MSETAGLCCHETGRAYGLDVGSALSWMEEQCSASETLTECFLNRTIFYREGRLAEDLAAAGKKCASALGSHFLVIFQAKFGPQADGAWGSPSEGIELKHSPIVSDRLVKPAARRLFKFVRQNREAALVVTALVRQYDQGYMVDDCAWRLVDRFGTIYEKPAEFRAGQQLVAAGISFSKPVRTFYRVAGHRHMPDFILFGANPMSFILEVDPSAGRRTSKRKSRRDQHYLEADVRYASWRGVKPDLITVLLAAGFLPLGT